LGLTWIAIGDSGTILRTTNFGSSWEIQSSPTTNDLYGVYFVDANTGFVVGDSGTILKTTDGGVNWSTQTSGTLNTLYGIYFSDADTGITVGGTGTILKTENGGVTWASQSSGTTNDLYGVFFAKIRTGWWMGGANFTWDILLKADSVIDFSDYENDGDTIVDMLFLMIMSGSGQTAAALNIPEPFTTNDTSISGDTILITSVNGIGMFTQSRTSAMYKVAHEYGHKLGLPDYYWFNNPVPGFGLGAFDPMSAAIFVDRPSSYNPWFRSNYDGWMGPFNWLTPIPVTSSLLNQPIEDITKGELYELPSDLVTDTLISGQKFLVSNHQKISVWEQK
jgi:M6 family metalloprotease-like protein